MFSDLTRYAFINAKIRSKIGNIFNDTDIEHLRKEAKYLEIIKILVEREYLNQKSVDLDNEILNIEYNLFLHLLDIYKKILQWTNEAKIKNFIKILLQRLEIKNLKEALRLWHKKDDNLFDYIYKDKIIYEIDYAKIVQADMFTEILNMVKETPYYSILNQAKDEFEKTNSLFILEVELDKYSYDLIFKNLDLLNNRDAQIVKKFYGLEADLTNFSLLFRFKNYYNLNYQSISDYLIPYGQTDKRNVLADEIYKKDKISFELFDFFHNVPDYILKDLNQKMSTELHLKDKMLLISDLLNQVITSQMNTTLSQYPFTIGIIIVYFLMKEIEIKNLVSILNLKYYKI